MIWFWHRWEKARRTSPTQGNKEDPLSVQIRKLLVGGQLRVENQLGGRFAGVFLPNLYELENLVGLLALGDTGIGISQDSLLGVTSQKDQNPLLRAAATGNIVLF